MGLWLLLSAAKGYTEGMENKRKTLILIDGNALIHRAYHALPPLSTKSGELVNAVYGFTVTLLSVLEKFGPEYIAASFDLAGPTFRHEKFDGYKGTRVKAPDELYAQIPRVKEVVEAFNIPIYEKAGFEADDVIGTLSRQAVEKSGDVEVVIVTGDRDALQLVNDRVKVFTMRKGVKDTVLYGHAGVVAKYSLEPEQLKDFKGLCGDSSDNIPGVKGIGEKGAIGLLQKYGSLENVYASLEEIRGALKKKLEEGRESAFLSKELGTIDTHVPVELDLARCVAHDFDRNKVAKLFQELGFYSLVKRLPGNHDKERGTGSREQGTGSKEQGRKAKKNKVVVLSEKAEIEEFLSQRKETGEISIVPDVQAGTLFGSSLQGVAICRPELVSGPRSRRSTEIPKQVRDDKLESAYVPYSPETKSDIQTLLEDEKIGKVLYDAKTVGKVLEREGIALRGTEFDVMLAGYLLNAGSDVSLEHLALEEFGTEYAFAFSGKKGVTSEEVAQKAESVLRLKERYVEKMHAVSQEQLPGNTLEKVFRDIEMPLIEVLAKMERYGVRLNTETLRKLSDEMAADLEKIEKDIYMFAGKEFNINSPRQLAQVLFEDLKIPTDGIKKLKTGFSTASPELAKLRGEYPIVQLIEQYRELFKLKTTYLDVLPRLTDERSRLHTTFHQAVTATGRLSSSDPNLQNIPVRNHWGERIRAGFEAEPGRVLVGADYSQIELRVAAHLADDEKMLEAFRNKEDIHRTTASLVHGVKPEDVTDEMRRQAKVLNFGIIYGMGSYGLAQAAGTDQQSAAKFIREYLQKFSGVAKYMEDMKAFARKHGYVETALGRRRYVAEINSPNQQIARAAERMAINMPIQGLEADIVKLAMIAADKLISEKFSDSVRMLLQVHDELIFEVKEGVAETFMPEIKKAMESVYDLKAPLVAEVFQGKNWGEI
jgi:DNA polymerase-1